ncbi:hypothetical protein chiPu_0032912, partial [Chiloscyllium punctatum]|nr:hypothetical protein [Chiloscyllium punctatum]
MAGKVDGVGGVNRLLHKCRVAAAPLTFPGRLFQRGKTVPEELVRGEDLSKYRQVASHV